LPLIAFPIYVTTRNYIIAIRVPLFSVFWRTAKPSARLSLKRQRATRRIRGTRRSSRVIVRHARGEIRYEKSIRDRPAANSENPLRLDYFAQVVKKVNLRERDSRGHFPNRLRFE